MRAHVLNHVPFETTGSIGEWLAARNATVTETQFYADATLPVLDGIDLIVVMGGPMSVNDEAELPWLVAEKQFLRDAIRKGTPILGICLGSQMIASALGARVRKNNHPEHGWFWVEGVGGRPSCFRFPAKFMTFHSHGETFDLPANAVHLARSSACTNQAFQVGRNVIGLQFHLESTPSSAGAIVEACANEFEPGPFVQPTGELRGAPEEQFAESRRLMGELLLYLINGNR
jgi:GMP synthase-like glutamine amidotransferase